MGTRDESNPSPALLTSPLDLGRVMRSRRTGIGMTQAQMATAVGVSAKWISEFENGKDTAEVGKIMRVLAHLGYGLAVEPLKQPTFDVAAHIESLAQER